MYYIHLWNKQWGKQARFLVEHNGKFAEYALSSPKDISWTVTDITKEKEYAGWDNWKKEPVESLDLIVM